MVVLHYTEEVCRFELTFIVIHKDRCSGYHLSIELTPNSLAPSCVGKCEVKRPLMHIMPVLGCEDMGKRIREIMHHHLRLTCCSTREIEKEVISHLVSFRSLERVCLLKSAPIVIPAIRYCRTYRNTMTQGWTVTFCFLYVTKHILVSASHDIAYTSHVATVDNIFVGEHVSCRNSNSTKFVKSNHGVPPLYPSFQYKHHPVTFLYAHLLKERSASVACVLECAISDMFLLAFIVYPDDCLLIRHLLGISVDYIISEIKILGYIDFEILQEVLVRGELRFFHKLFKHTFVFVLANA